MARKTIDVAYVLEKGNHFLRESDKSQKGERQGVASMIELVLHETGNYNGFRYLESAGVDYSILDAYNADPEGCGMTGPESVQRAFQNADESRREYYRSAKLYRAV